MAKLTIQDDAFTQLGPCVLVVDDENHVRWVSERLTRLLGAFIDGQMLDRFVVSTDRPFVALALRKGDGTMLPLRGHWISSAVDHLRAFIGAPAPSTTEEMRQLGITVDDFLKDDAWIKYLIQADECTATQDDARERIGQLKREQAKLGEARDEMRDAQRAALNMLNDIAAAKREADEAHEQLQKAHGETRQLFEAISSVLIGVDRDGRVTAWNGTAERTFGIEEDKAVGQLFGNLEIEWDQAAVTEGISECLANGAPRRLDEMRFKKPDGADGFLGMTLNPLNGGPDKHGGFLLVAMDITEQKILQSQLGEAQKLESIGQLAAGIAHEINTPIQFVGDNTRFQKDSFADLGSLLEQYERLRGAARDGSVTAELLAEVEAAIEEADLEYLREEIPKAIEQSLEGVERVTKIVRSMKEFSHPGGNDKQPADLNKAIESTITVSRNEWKYVAEMTMDLDSALPPVPCLLGDFNQVVLNMIVNAAHAITDVVGKDSGEKGTITVSTRQEGDWAEIRISDTGAGMPAEVRAKVFDPFFTTKEVGKGTGQGLAIARNVVVQKHGGTIDVESQVGQGTVFIIRLPIDQKTNEPAETREHETAHPIC